MASILGELQFDLAGVERAPRNSITAHHTNADRPPCLSAKKGPSRFWPLVSSSLLMLEISRGLHQSLPGPGIFRTHDEQRRCAEWPSIDPPEYLP
jgi:hypothetical protein